MAIINATSWNYEINNISLNGIDTRIRLKRSPLIYEYFSEERKVSRIQGKMADLVILNKLYLQIRTP